MQNNENLKNSNPEWGQPFDDYKSLFIQRLPRYGVKRIGGKSWRTKNKPLSDIPIKAHLDKKYCVGVLAKWYPECVILDIDNRSIEQANEIREELGLIDSDSMLISSESPDSSHLLIRPQYNGNPPTVRLLQDAFKGFGSFHHLEIYPQPKRFIRLPFGHAQDCLDLCYRGLDDWKAKLYWFQKLDEFNLSNVPSQQLFFDFKLNEDVKLKSPGIMNEARELLKHGLFMPSSRHESQFKILFYFWRMNVDQDEAEETVWSWIRRMHNGFSKEIIRNPRSVRKQISRQASLIYDKYDLASIFPDSTHNVHRGYICELDIIDIIRIARASLPKMNFLFNLVKYAYPRRNRLFIQIHRDKLIEWANERTYLKRIAETMRGGVIERYDSYSAGWFSKSVKIKWPWRDSSQAVLHDGRSLDTLKETLRILYKTKPDHLKQLLSDAGATKQNVYDFIKSVFGR
ncbi:hypothetical protein ES705_13254 [subsurface metagenome]